MKILHIVPSMSQGGTEAVMMDVVTNTPHYRHVVTTFMDLPDFFPTPGGVAVHKTGIIKQDTGSLWLRRLQALQTGWRIAKIARAERPDVIVGWLFPSFCMSLMAKFACGAKLVWSSHCPDLEAAGVAGETFRVKMRLCGVLSQFVNAIHYVSQDSRMWHETYGFRADRGVVARNGVDTKRFNVGARGTDERFVLVNPARFDEQKDHATLFKAIRILADEGHSLIVKCAGRGTETAEFAKLAAEHGVTGYIEALGQRRDIETLYKTSDAAVLSSAYETSPLVAMESLACGIPLIGTNTGDVTETVGGCGVVVPIRDPRALADAIRQVMTDKSIAARSRLEGPRRASAHYSCGAMVERWCAMLLRVHQGADRANPMTPFSIACAVFDLVAHVLTKALALRALGYGKRLAISAVPPRRTIAMGVMRLLISAAVLRMAAMLPAGPAQAATIFCGNAFFFFAVFSTVGHMEGVIVGGIVDKLRTAAGFIRRSAARRAGAKSNSILDGLEPTFAPPEATSKLRH